MTKVSCLVEERHVNPLFEVFDGGDFILSSWRDVEQPLAEMRIYFDPPADELADRIAEAKLRLSQALEVVGATADVAVSDVPDEDWKFAYRRHFKTESVGRRLLVVPEWEFAALTPETVAGRETVVLDPGMAFGTGKHETTRACLEFIDALAAEAGRPRSFLDMGSGSGILSIAAAKLGYAPVVGFDVDQEAVDASVENAAKNAVRAEFFRYGLGAKVRRELPPADLVTANILGPLLIRFADEIAAAAPKRLIVSGILNELYPEVLAAYVARGFAEVAHKSIGEWSTGLLERR